jgi:hypothetical protein
MRLPRVQWTVRWIMVAVAVVSLSFSLDQTWRRYRFCYAHVSDLTEKIQNMLTLLKNEGTGDVLGAEEMLAEEVARPGSTAQGADEWRKDIVEYRRRLAEVEKEIARCERRLRLFRRLGTHPWEPIPDDLWSSPDAWPPDDLWETPNAVRGHF